MTADRESYEEKKKELLIKYNASLDKGIGYFCMNIDFLKDFEQLVKAQAEKDERVRILKILKQLREIEIKTGEDFTAEEIETEILKLIQEGK